MLGLLYLFLCIVTGYSLVSLLMPSVFNFFETTYTGKKIKFPSFFLVTSMSLVLGIMLLSWITYFTAYALRAKADPLYMGLVVSSIAGTVLVVITLIVRGRRYFSDFAGMFKNFTFTDTLICLIITVFTSIFMFSTFYVKGNLLEVGLSVFSDFSPHIGMIKSFSRGDNFPTSYSHFAGEDIKYHFMFQFFVGALEYLGLRIDLAFNIPSILCFICVCMLLYSLAVKLFSKRGVGYLAIFFFLFRSGSAFFSFVGEYSGKLKNIGAYLYNNNAFIGETEHEDWGLWNLNVYVNQRHLALGLCLVLISIIIMLQYTFDNLKRLKALQCKEDSFTTSAGKFIRNGFFTKNGYFSGNVMTPIFVGLMLGMGAFFNGACVIAALLVLFMLAWISDGRFSFLLMAIITVGLSYAQSSFFISGSALDFRYEPGFLAAVTTFFGILKYLRLLLGILPFVILAAFLMVNGYYKWIIVAFTAPLVFAVTFQMTVDVAVNHKYIMISCMLMTVFAAALIYKVFLRKGLATKVVAVMLCLALTITGIYDLYIIIKRNNPNLGGMIGIDRNSGITKWVSENATSKDIILSDWYALNEVVLGGGMLYYGWPYYAWSAGYDTDYRELQAKQMFGAYDSATLDELVKENKIRYIIVDNAVRTNDIYEVNEKVISGTYKSVYQEGEGDWLFTIYDTEKRY